MEGLLRVAIDRPEARKEIEPLLREAFEIYSGIFNQAWPAGQEVEDEGCETVLDEQLTAAAPEHVDRPEVLPEPEPAPVLESAPEPEAEPVPVPEPVQEQEPESEPQIVEIEAEPETEYSAPSARPLADTLKVDELIARKESADLRRAFTLNDKFRFRRTLFGGSDARFGEVLDALESMGNYDEARAYLSGIIDMEGEDSEDFLNIVNAHFSSKS